jgi:hypothetical protein
MNGRYVDGEVLAFWWNSRGTDVPADHPLDIATIMKPPTDYIRHAARLARKIQLDAAMGGTPQPDAEFFKTLSKAMDEIATGLELVSKRE